MPGQPIHGPAPHRIAERGIARTFQFVELFRHRSVLDNIVLGRHRHMRAGVVAGALFWGRSRREEIREREHVVGIQKLVAIGRALAVAPTLLLLDEPSTGMNREEKENLARLMLRIKHELGTTMLWIEHDMELVADLADTVTMLDFGEKIAEGPPDIVLTDRRIAEAYLGRAYIAEKGPTP